MRRQLACVLLTAAITGVCALQPVLSNKRQRRSPLKNQERRTTTTRMMSPQQQQPTAPPPLQKPAWRRELFNPTWPLLGLAPFGQRKTVVEEIVKDEIWAFDQSQGILYVQVPVRMIVAKIDDDGLLLYAPNAPTQECLREVRRLEREQNATVEHVVLPTLGVEHKAFFGQFCLSFPKATVWYTPGQWSFPVNFANLAFLGLFQRGRVRELPSRGTDVIPGIDVSTLGPLLPPPDQVGGFAETTFFHKRTRTLLVVDVFVKVPREPPPVIQYDKRCLLFHARDDNREVVDDPDDDKVLAKGWRRLALFAFFFQPAALDVVPVPECFFQRKNCGMKGVFGWFDLYPFEWNAKEADRNFESLARPKFIVAPILQELILNRKPDLVLDWLNDVTDRFDFTRIVPCHLATSIAATPSDLLNACSFLFNTASSSSSLPASQFADDDLVQLRNFEVDLIKAGSIYPRPTAVPDRPKSGLRRNLDAWWAGLPFGGGGTQGGPPRSGGGAGSSDATNATTTVPSVVEEAT